MRSIAFILALIVLALSCLPCADAACAMNSDNARTELAKMPAQQHDEHHNDACSPFCHCTCCASFSINYSVATISVLMLYNSKSFATYLPDNIIEVSLPVWQPPQLG
jgi:hypothetical protein